MKRGMIPPQTKDLQGLPTFSRTKGKSDWPTQAGHILRRHSYSVCSQRSPLEPLSISWTFLRGSMRTPPFMVSTEILYLWIWRLEWIHSESVLVWVVTSWFSPGAQLEIGAISQTHNFSRLFFEAVCCPAISYTSVSCLGVCVCFPHPLMYRLNTLFPVNHNAVFIDAL